MDEIFEFTLVMGTDQIYLSVNSDWSVYRYGWNSRNHNHPGMELHVILEGSCSVDVDGTTYQLGKGQTILIGAGRYHRPICVSPDLQRFSVSFFPEQGTLQDALAKEVSACQICDAPRELVEVCRKIFQECEEETPFRNTIMRSLLTLLLGYEFRALGISGESGGSTDAANYSKYTDSIDAFFENCPAEEARVDTLAGQLHLSRSQVNRVLKRLYGMTFREKLIRSRMDQAAWLLRHTEKAVGEIAGEVGYQSESRFYQMFRVHFGMTPETYRTVRGEE